jgi:hypothetical protein
MKKSLLVVSIIISIVLIDGCKKKANESKEQSQQLNAGPGATAAPNDVAGIHWTVPQGWTAQPRQQMRAATYTVPAPKEGIEPGDCGIFYFGSGQGGTVEDNLNRWISQFEKGGKHEFSGKEINSLKVTTIQIAGTYLSPTGAMMESKDKRPNYRLLGAIVEAPQGTVFFKFTGPAQTVEATESNFNQLINSMAKD